MRSTLVLPLLNVARTVAIFKQSISHSNEVGCGDTCLVWNEVKIAQFMDAHPQRAYFSRVLQLGCFNQSVGLEVGVADGRFSEHMLLHARPSRWHMVEPAPTRDLVQRIGCNYAVSTLDSPCQGSHRQSSQRIRIEATVQSWASRQILSGSRLYFHRGLSMDARVLRKLSRTKFDFIYLDGAHDYENVKRELTPYWNLLNKGGILAGHDYCNYGEPSLGCLGCEIVPLCPPYTEFGLKHGKRAQRVIRRGVNQNGVVRAVQEWLVENHPASRLRHTVENFTHKSLAANEMDYNLVITMTRNPSWYIVKGYC